MRVAAYRMRTPASTPDFDRTRHGTEAWLPMPLAPRPARPAGVSCPCSRALIAETQPAVRARCHRHEVTKRTKSRRDSVRLCTPRRSVSLCPFFRVLPSRQIATPCGKSLIKPTKNCIEGLFYPLACTIMKTMFGDAARERHLRIGASSLPRRMASCPEACYASVGWQPHADAGQLAIGPHDNE